MTPCPNCPTPDDVDEEDIDEVVQCETCGSYYEVTFDGEEFELELLES